jgi:hypothetical protein
MASEETSSIKSRLYREVTGLCVIGGILLWSSGGIDRLRGILPYHPLRGEVGYSESIALDDGSEATYSVMPQGCVTPFRESAREVVTFSRGEHKFSLTDYNHDSVVDKAVEITGEDELVFSRNALGNLHFINLGYLQPLNPEDSAREFDAYFREIKETLNLKGELEEIKSVEERLLGEQPQETVAYQNEQEAAEEPSSLTENPTAQLAQRVLDLSDRLYGGYFGINGAICLGPDENGNNRYAVLGGYKREFINLKISVYTNLDPELEALVNEYIQTYDYKSASEVLKESDTKKVEFWDFDVDGLIAIRNDLIRANAAEGEFIGALGTELSEGERARVNEGYAAVLEILEPILQQDLEARNERHERMEQEKAERRAAFEKEWPLERQIETMLQELEELGY